jgi:hypothetical protein
MKTTSTRPQRAPKAMDYTAFLERFSEKDRKSVERQIMAYEAKAGPEPAERWRRIAALLLTLAPMPGKMPAKFASSHALQFFIPDGKYRMQVFAVHGAPDGSVAIYAPDVLAQAVRERILLGNAEGENLYRLKSKEPLTIEPLDGKTPNPDPIYKDMTGWNRKAMRIILPASASEEQIHAAEQLCILAARQWATAE